MFLSRRFVGAASTLLLLGAAGCGGHAFDAYGVVTSTTGANVCTRSLVADQPSWTRCFPRTVIEGTSTPQVAGCVRLLLPAEGGAVIEAEVVPCATARSKIAAP